MRVATPVHSRQRVAYIKPCRAKRAWSISDDMENRNHIGCRRQRCAREGFTRHTNHASQRFTPLSPFPIPNDRNLRGKLFPGPNTFTCLHHSPGSQSFTAGDFNSSSKTGRTAGEPEVHLGMPLRQDHASASSILPTVGVFQNGGCRSKDPPRSRDLTARHLHVVLRHVTIHSRRPRFPTAWPFPRLITASNRWHLAERIPIWRSVQADVHGSTQS